MEIKLDDVFKKKNSEFVSKVYTFDNTVQQDNFCDLLEKLEDENIKFYECNCSTYDDYGMLWSPCFKSIDELREYPFENAWVNFCADFIDKKTEEYRFSVITANNKNKIKIKYDSKLEDLVKESQERRKMFEEYDKKKAEEEKQNSEGGYTK